MECSEVPRWAGNTPQQGTGRVEQTNRCSILVNDSYGVQQPEHAVVGAGSSALRSSAPSRCRQARPGWSRPGSPSWNAGGDGPAWSRKRQPYQAPDPDATQPLHRPDSPAVPYAELHCHSNFSFLDGASHPEQLAEEAARLGLEALAITDHDGLYGVVRFAEAATGRRSADRVRRRAHARHRRPPARCSAKSDDPAADRHRARPRPPCPDPHGDHLLVLADGPTGYGRAGAGARAWAIWQARRARRSSPCSTSPTRWPATAGCSPAVARGRCRPRSSITARRRRPRSCAG